MLDMVFCFFAFLRVVCAFLMGMEIRKVAFSQGVMTAILSAIASAAKRSNPG